MRYLYPVATALLATTLLAQQPPIEREGVGTVDAEPIGAPGPDVPPPPKHLLNDPAKHGMPILPVVGTPRPIDGAPELAGIEEGREVGGTYVTFSNPNVKPSGASTSRVMEPHTRLADANNGFLTHNWSAARTTNGGGAWTRVNPYTRFSAANGGFCCDQVLATGNGVTAWLLQYVKDGNGNVQRIAIADNPGEVGNDTWSRSYNFSATPFGYAASDWLDYPDAAATNEYFYFTSNVFNQANRYQGSVIWRFRIADAQAGGSLSYSYINSAGGSRGGSFRLAQGATGDMYIGSHVNTSRLRIIRWLNAGGFQTFERDVASWSSNYQPAPGPDGKDWTQRADSRISGGYASETEVGFVWHVGATTGRPFNYLKLVRLDAATVDVTNQRDIWSSADAFMYPTAATNAYGHIAIICGAGGPGRYPSTCTLLDDDLETFGTYRIFATSNSGPDANVWGDYLACAQYPSSASYGTFYGTGFRLSGGGANSDGIPEFVHFGREAYGPSFVGLTVRSQPSGASITCTADANGENNGTTPFVRAFATGAAYSVTAPARTTSGGSTWLFDRWAVKGVVNTAFSLASVGQRTYGVSSIGSIDDITEARYVRERTLRIRSSNPGSGVSIGVSPSDFDGNGNGSTSFDRLYKDGTQVTLTAPSSSGCNPFRRWVINGQAQSTGNRTVTVTMDGTETAIAEYTAITPGTIGTIGSGCIGTNGSVPNHTITHGNGGCGPLQGTPTNYNVSRGPASAPCVLQLGTRTDFNGPIRLPWNLGPLGAPGCTIYHDLSVGLGFGTDTRGNGSLTIVSPVDRSAVSFNWYTSVTLLDFGNNRLNIVQSNAMRVAQGGAR